MSQGFKKVTILFIYLFCLAKGYSQSNELPEYGFAIGDKCGQVINTDFSNGHLSIHISFPETKTLCGKLNGNTLTGTFEGQSFTMTFERDGVGKGHLADSTKLTMLRGRLTHHHELELSLKSMEIYHEYRSKLHNRYAKDIIGVYIDKTEVSYGATIVFKHQIDKQRNKGRLINLAAHLEENKWLLN